MAGEHNSGEPRAVSVGVLKGGFGKTTTAINLARELAHRNGSALVVDLDDNGHMSQNLGFTEQYSAEENHAEAVLINGEDPTQYIQTVSHGLDIFPAHVQLEDVQSGLKEATMGTTRLKENLINPLLGDEYEYIVVDCPANRGKLNDNAMYATGNIIIPLRAESGYESGLSSTVQRLVQEARQYFELNILAITPTDLQDRIDQDTRDRSLLKEINNRDGVSKLVPNYARITSDDWEAIDQGKQNGNLPGIRHRAAIDRAHDEGVPLRDYDEACDQLEAYDELAQIVEQGEVVHK
ncbi:SojC2 [Haladaptatus paucihalophilus DX253]|uniref:Chromosome partitioning protein n=1 Tax=Haladaptatus paucihalophilus DX253 TaxID=797209 RepID=E7QWG5_HALPU|nr:MULTISPECIES: ParA family protein [Haladaptatus]EFW91061.1 SojC2 [Haladaptatus paucihalophilus DX253]GKZ15376.1 chromosome partitioning protein ParA [Haladaptatus sp. T7]SHL38434.1 chromosome partitioning protein [Haladaptatus paucihalophilus DX253]